MNSEKPSLSSANFTASKLKIELKACSGPITLPQK
tara:strand:- start:1469 stop:1573 length:105 start_codon:yes stop_codon:yes gene_type:complete